MALFNAGLSRVKSTRERNSVRVGNRQSLFPAKALPVMAVAAAHVWSVAVPVQVEPLQVWPSAQRFHVS